MRLTRCARFATAVALPLFVALTFVVLFFLASVGALGHGGRAFPAPWDSPSAPSESPR